MPFGVVIWQSVEYDATHQVSHVDGVMAPNIFDDPWMIPSSIVIDVAVAYSPDLAPSLVVSGGKDVTSCTLQRL